MGYASITDIRTRYGATVVEQWGLSDEADNTAFMTQALDDASRFIDSFLSGHVTEPIVDSPLLTRLCVDVAVYWLAIDAGLETDEKRRRFEDAKDWLQRLSRGELALDAGTTSEQGRAEGASFSSQPRVMSRETLTGF